MAIVTLTELRTRVRQRADQVNSTFISDAEMDSLINVGKKTLDDLLVRNFGEDYFATSVTFVTTAGTENYSLSTITSGSFYKLLALSVSTSNGWVDAKPYTLRDRNMLRSVGSSIVTVSPGSAYRYRVTGSNLSLLPVPAGVTRMEMAWVPQSTSLSATTDSFDDINGWSEIIVLDAAIAIKDKAEEDTSVLQNDRDREEARIIASAPNRDAGEPMTVADVLTADPRSMWWVLPR